MGMGRYRAPQPASSQYVTPEGYQRLQHELTGLWKRRSTVTKALKEAAAEGDRSENAEYIYRKKELGGIDRRIRYLQKRLPEFNVIHDLPVDQTKVFFGAWVTLKQDDGHEEHYRIVGTDEINSSLGYISIDAPLAKALLKKNRDDDVTVQTPQGEVNYYISAIHYRTPDE